MHSVICYSACLPAEKRTVGHVISLLAQTDSMLSLCFLCLDREDTAFREQAGSWLYGLHLRGESTYCVFPRDKPDDKLHGLHLGG